MSTMRNSVMLIGRATKPIMDTERQQATFKLVVEDSVNKTCITNTFDCVTTPSGTCSSASSRSPSEEATQHGERSRAKNTSSSTSTKQSSHDTRDAQKAYFQTRTYSDLDRSKQLEKTLDRAIDEYLNPNTQIDLFG